MIATDLTLREAVLCFSWSRMAVIDSQKVRGHIKETHLPLEGFYEALTRMCMLKALPTTQEIVDAGCADSAEYFLDGPLSNADMYRNFCGLGTNKTEWGLFEIPGGRGEPIEQRLDHLIRLIIGTMEMQMGRKVSERDGSLSEAEGKKWCAANLKTK